MRADSVIMSKQRAWRSRRIGRIDGRASRGTKTLALAVRP
jgi:hypothetical protein